MKKLLLISALLTVSLNANAKCDKDFLVVFTRNNEFIINTNSISFIDNKDVLKTGTTKIYSVTRIHFNNGDKIQVMQTVDELKKKLCLK